MINFPSFYHWFLLLAGGYFALAAVCNATPSAPITYSETKEKVQSPISPERQKLQVSYIANEGVLLQFGEKKVLIDALHRPYSSYYLSTPDSILQKIMATQPPFDGIDVLLVSHVHGDHFHAGTVAEYISKNKKVQLIGAPQMQDSIVWVCEDFENIKDRIHTFPYQSGTQHVLEIAGIKITLYDLVHGSDRNVWVENLASKIELGEHDILHMGDPDLRTEPLETFHFEKQNITLGLLPDWYLTSAEAKILVEKYIAPKDIIAVHVSPQWEADSRKKMTRFFPAAEMFSRPMERRVFE